MISKYLLKVLGKKNVSEEEIDKLSYSVDASQLEGKTDLVVWPENAEQVHNVVLYARRNKRDLVVRGSGTNLVGGTIPNNSTVMDLSKMNKILQASRVRLFVDVEPGVILNDLNRILKKVGLFFPIEPYSRKVKSIGGMVATNAIGDRSIRYGRVENWISELDVIDGSGKLIKVRGSKIKDFCGTEGILGVIVKARLKLAEVVKERSMSLYAYSDVYDLVQKVRKLKENEDIMAVEFVSRVVASLDKEEEPKNYLLVEFEGEQGQVSEEDKIEELWKMRDNAYNVLMSRGYNRFESFSIPLKNMSHFLEWLRDNDIPSFGSIGIGVINAVFKKNEDKKIERMYKMVEKLEGLSNGVYGIGLLKKKYVNNEFLENIKKLKRQYDPDNILNRGKVV